MIGHPLRAVAAAFVAIACLSACEQMPPELEELSQVIPAQTDSGMSPEDYVNSLTYTWQDPQPAMIAWRTVTAARGWDAGVAVNLKHQFFAAKNVAADMTAAGLPARIRSMVLRCASRPNASRRCWRPGRRPMENGSPTLELYPPTRAPMLSWIISPGLITLGLGRPMACVLCTPLST